MDNSNTSLYRGRFAPSPTGSLHLGSLYTAVASFLEARSRQGQWLLRIDDADTPRNVEGAADDILKTLEVFGLHWDETVFYQSQQHDHYQTTLEQLKQSNLIYPCVCSRKNLRNAPNHKVYSQFCRDKTPLINQPHALRVKTGSSIIKFQDELQGLSQHNIASDYGDFIIYRKDNIISYQLAVVIDDDLQQINHVVRGLDLLDSTPRQLYLQALLGFSKPSYLHIPIITHQDGKKLSKQTFAKAINKQQPEKTLFFILQLLKQQPPLELKKAPVTEILSWAIEHWQVKRLKNIHSISNQA